MSYFAIAAPQTVVLPNGLTLDFRIDPQDSSIVEIHLRGLSLDGQQGTYIMPFKRNGSPAGRTEFIPTPDAPQPAAAGPDDYEAQKHAERSVVDGEYSRAGEDKTVTTETLQSPIKSV